MDSWSAIHAMAFNKTRVLAAAEHFNSLWTIDVETGRTVAVEFELGEKTRTP